MAKRLRNPHKTVIYGGTLVRAAGARGGELAIPSCRKDERAAILGVINAAAAYGAEASFRVLVGVTRRAA